MTYPPAGFCLVDKAWSSDFNVNPCQLGLRELNLFLTYLRIPKPASYPAAYLGICIIHICLSQDLHLSYLRIIWPVSYLSAYPKTFISPICVYQESWESWAKTCILTICTSQDLHLYYLGTNDDGVLNWCTNNGVFSALGVPYVTVSFGGKNW